MQRKCGRVGRLLDRELICLKTIQVAGKGGLSSSHIGRDWGSSGNSRSFQGPKSVTWGHIVAPTSLAGTRSSCIGSPQIPVSPLTPFLPGLQGPLAAHTFFPNPLSKLEEPLLRGLPTSLSSREAPVDPRGAQFYLSFHGPPSLTHLCLEEAPYTEELPAPAADKPPGWVFHSLPPPLPISLQLPIL